MPDAPLGKHTFYFNPEDNGGESLTLTTEFWANGEAGGILTTQDFSLQSDGNSATIHLGSYLTPDMLRKLADELDDKINLARMMSAYDHQEEQK